MNDKAKASEYSSRRSIPDLTHGEAQTFLLKPDSYCSLELPPYIMVGDLINGVHQVLEGKSLSK